MGGSFDPVHLAHVALAEEALARLALDEVRWVPVGQPWQKARQLAPAADRLAMVGLATAHEPRFVLDDIEVRRAGPSYTLDTVRSLQAAEPDAQWWLVIGQDQCVNLPTWQGWAELLQRVGLAVACRGDAPAAVSPEVAQAAVRGIQILTMPPMAVSSTAIRGHLNAGGFPLDLTPGLVPAGVARYIADHHLYAP
ncbi:MAG: nicotinate (nicotinamide) nucleotide adenylyltransferase [Pseudomonadota bacterium]|jgi:nicotinate-nucleotide adenylyltransferase